MTPYPRNDTRLPLAEHTRDDCSTYFDGFLFVDLDLSSSPSDDVGAIALGLFTDRTPCSIAAGVFRADVESLGLWNPSLGNTTLSNCSFAPDKRYCGQLYFNVPEPVTDDDQTYELEIRVSLFNLCCRHRASDPLTVA